MNKSATLPEDVVKTSEVIGVDVENNDEENLGTIQEIILDKVEGQVRYVVLSFGGIFGLGGKLFALPWKSLHFDEERDCFILDVDKEKLINAPSFDKENWPTFSDRKWGESIHNYYGSRPYWDDKK